MKKVTELNKKNIEFIWITSHWDVHREGLCQYDGNLCYFKIIDNEDDFYNNNIKYSIYELTWKEKLHYLKRKKLFEWMVGYHWTYKNGKITRKFRMRKPKWFWTFIFNLYFKLFI